MKDTPPNPQPTWLRRSGCTQPSQSSLFRHVAGQGVDLEAERTDGAIPPARQVVILHTADPQK